MEHSLKCDGLWSKIQSCFCVIPGYPLKLYFQIPCVFPVRPHIFPVPIYIICECYIHRTDLADLSSFWENKYFFFAATIAIFLLLESDHLQLELTKFPVFSLCLDKIPCVFPDRELFWPFSLFSPVPWVPCIRSVPLLGIKVRGALPMGHCMY